MSLHTCVTAPQCDIYILREIESAHPRVAMNKYSIFKVNWGEALGECNVSLD